MSSTSTSYDDSGPAAGPNAGGPGSDTDSILKRSNTLDSTTSSHHLTITTAFYTASTWNSDFSLATYHSVEDPAVVKFSNTAEFRSAFRDIDVTHLITDIASRPSGFGGSADVKQAYLRGSQVAMKFPRIVNVDIEVARKLAREIGVWRSLSHPNILPLSGLFWDDNQLPAMISPWCSNGNVMDYIDKQRRVLGTDILSLQLQLLDDSLAGLAHLHSLRIVHGDLKGVNILVCDDGVACIADFGVSAVLAQYPAQNATPAGTYRWMAPELLQDDSRVTWASDMWAYGCVIMEVMSGTPPYAALQERQVIIALHNGELPSRPPSICDSLWDLCELCFEAPCDRPHAELLLKSFRALSKDLLLGHADVDLPAADSPGPDLDLLDKLLTTAFNHLQENLPCYSGKSLQELELDASMSSSVDGLIRVSRWLMSKVCYLLLQLLEKLSKETHDSSSLWRHDVLQSQVIVIRTVSAALTAHWDLKREQQNCSKFRAHPSEVPVDSWVDPPYITNHDATYMTSTMGLYIRQTRHVVDRPPELLHMTDDTSSYSFEHLGETDTHATPTSVPISSNSLNQLILNYTARIVFHVSASNWPSIFARIRKGIRLLAAHGTDPELIDETDVDMWLMAYCCLDRARLVQVLQDLSSLFVTMRLEAQISVAQALRHAMWSWINVFHDEFSEAAVKPRKLEGAAERLYDVMQQLVDNDRRIAFLPILMILLAVSPERCKQLETQLAYGIGTTTSASERRGNSARLAAWTEIYRMLGSTSNMAELAMTGFLQLCKCGVVVPPELESPIRSLAPDIAQELSTRIITPPPPLRPYYDTVEHPIDIGLYSDVLVAVFRFSPQTAISQLFLPSLNALRSDAVKTVVVKACLTLVLDARRMPHQPSIEPLYQCASRIRQIYIASCRRQHEVSEVGQPIRASNRPSAKKYYEDDSTSERDLFLLACHALWRTDLRFLFNDTSTDDVIEIGVAGMDLLRQQSEEEVQLSVCKTMAMLFLSSSAISPDSPIYEAARLYHRRSTSEVLTTCVTLMLQQPFDTNSNRILIPHILMVLTRYADDAYPEDEEAPWKYSPDRLPSFLAAEFALVIALSSPGMDVTLLVAHGLQLLARAERHERAPRPPLPGPEEQLKRWAVYEQIGEERFKYVGRLAYQKRLRQLFRVVSPPNPFNLALFNYCFTRWLELSQSVVQPAESTNAALKAGWQNLTFALAGMVGGCIALEGENTEIRSLAKHMPQHLEHVATLPNNPPTLATQFIRKLMDMLDNENAVIRETAKDALGAELHPRLFTVLLQQIERVMNRAGADPERADDEIALLFEQCMSVLKAIFDRIDTPPELSMLNVDVSRMTLILLRFINRGNNTIRASFRERIEFCQLCDSLMVKRNFLTIRNESSLRNEVVDRLFGWIKDSQALRSIDPSYTRLQAECDGACLKTAVNMLEKMRLEPPESATSSDTANLLSRTFRRYLTEMQLMAGIHSMGSMKSEDDVAESSSSSLRTTRDEPAIRALVVKGVVNMLQANPDAGTKHCLALGFHDDLRLRIQFCHIFARALASGRKLESPATVTSPPQRNQLCEMLRESDMLALAICEICPANEVDVIIPVLLNVFDTRDSLLRLMKSAIDRQVALTGTRVGCDKELFRSNTVWTRLLGAFAKTQGYNYLRKVIKPIVEGLQAMPADQSVEVDPIKASNASEEELKQNMANLKVIAQALLDIICDSTPLIPPIMMDVCKHITNTVGNVWPASRQTALGAFLFLRFICPAIVAPHTVDIDLPKENNEIRRGLVLLTKIIQNLANNVLFGKEQFLTDLNPFLNENARKVQAFQETVARGTSDGDHRVGTADIGTYFDETDAIVLQRFFHLHADKVGKELLSYQGHDSSNMGKKTWNMLCTALVDLGRPIERPQLIPLDSQRHPRLIDFLQRNQHRSTESVRQLFTETSIDPERSLVFKLALSRLNAETDDLGLVLLQIFKTLLEFSAHQQPFEIVIDCTMFAPSSELPLPWIKYLIELIPSDLALQFQTAYVVNTNGAAQLYLRKVLHALANVPFGKQITAINSLEDLADVLPLSSVAAIDSSASLDGETKESFPEVYQVLRGAARIPVTFQLGTTHIRITSTKARQIFPGVQCKTTEIIPLSDIGDVTPYSSDRSPEFTIRRQRQGSPLIFASESRDVIMKAIRLTKSRLKSEETMSIDRSSRNVVLSATLINVGLLHLCNDEEMLRSAAYDLLCALCTYLDYDGSPILPSRGEYRGLEEFASKEEPAGGFVPQNATAVSLPFSETLSRFAPQLTLDFLFEFSIAFDKLSAGQKTISMQCIAPWLRNLPMFMIPLNPLYEQSSSKLRDCMRFLIDLTVKDSEIYPLAQRHVWSEIGRLDSGFISLALDELIRAAVDGGIGSLRCELVADTLVSLSTVTVRGKVITRLRKAFSKTSLTHTRNLIDNPAWPEIAALTRLALVVSYNTRNSIQTQLFVPETAHLITILASVGTVIMRTSVHGLALNLIQSLFASRLDHAQSAEQLRVLLDIASSPETLRAFGLSRTDRSSEFNAAETFSDVEAVDALENIAKLLVKVIAAAAPSIALQNVWRARWMSLVESTALQVSPYIQCRAFTVLGVLSHSEVNVDLLYHVLVALQKALRTGDEVEALYIVSMIRCLTNVVPGLPPSSRYLPQLFWIPVILLQTSDTIIFKESLRLLDAVVRTLQGHQLLAENGGLANYMLATRDSFADVISQVEQVQGINFDVSFTFSLTALICRGIHIASTREAVQSTLRTLLRATTRSSPVHDEPRTSVDPDAVAYFIALLFCGTPTEEEAAELLHDAGLSVEQLALPLHLPTRGRDGRLHLLRSTEMLGLTDKAKSALFAVGLVLMMEATSSPTLVQQVNMIQFLSDVGHSFAEYAMMACTYRLEALPGPLHDLLNRTSDPEVVQIVSRFSHMAMDAATRPRSSSTAGKTRVTLRSSLQEEGMAGLLEERPFTDGLDAEVMEPVDKVLSVILETPSESSRRSEPSELVSFADF